MKGPNAYSIQGVIRKFRWLILFSPPDKVTKQTPSVNLLFRDKDDRNQQPPIPQQELPRPLGKAHLSKKYSVHIRVLQLHYQTLTDSIFNPGSLSQPYNYSVSGYLMTKNIHVAPDVTQRPEPFISWYELCPFPSVRVTSHCAKNRIFLSPYMEVAPALQWVLVRMTRPVIMRTLVWVTGHAW